MKSIYDTDCILNTGTIERLAACNWIDEGKNFLITGSTDSGKNYISNALCISALRLFHTVRYVKASTLIYDLEQAQVPASGPSFSNIAVLLLRMGPMCSWRTQPLS